MVLHAIAKRLKIPRTHNIAVSFRMRFVLSLALLSMATSSFGQPSGYRSSAFAAVHAVHLVASFYADQQTPTPPAPDQPKTGDEAVPKSKRQPKRILGVMPNYRAVSAGAIPPPPTLKQAFKIATQNSFDYSAFLFTGFTSAIADGQQAHKQLGVGITAYWSYYWRGYLDKTDGNYLVIFALPTLFHQDERYYALGKGSIGKRAIYAASRILITPNYHGHASLNASELLGRAMAQGISSTYYPSADRTAGELATKLGYSLMRDALTNVFREFWPDIATHVLHRHP
jgi:hypothetical protein